MSGELVMLVIAVTGNPLFKTRPTVNPYLYAASLAWSRLTWDMTLRSWVSRARLRTLRDSHPGQKAVIVCNGPSLLGTDWSLLADVYTFGLNKINLLFDSVSFRPSCIVSVNPLVLEQNAAFFNTTAIPLFLDRVAAAFDIRFRQNVVALHSTGLNRFARDCSISIYQGGTVTFVAMQLAFHMGFTDVAVIGCDHSFTASGAANEKARREGTDSDHFHPDYFPDGEFWHLPDLDLSEGSYRLGRRIFEAYGRRVVNATDGGRLEVFPRMSLAEFLGD